MVDDHVVEEETDNDEIAPWGSILICLTRMRNVLVDKGQLSLLIY